MIAFNIRLFDLKLYLDIHQNKDYGTWRVIYSGVAITMRGLSTISSLFGINVFGYLRVF